MFIKIPPSALLMNDKIETYSQATNNLNYAVQNSPTDPKKVKDIKTSVQESYSCWGHMVYDKAFLNWGLWDKNIYQEYGRLDFNFTDLCPFQDIHSQLLVYYLIKPLIQKKFFNKKLLEIGCGNGIGLKMGSQLLRTEFALGVDLVHKLVRNSKINFSSPEEVNYTQMDAESLALDSGSFNIITNLESSHLYPRLESFYEEVARVLAPGGYFCYADIYIDAKKQPQRLEQFIANRQDLRIVKKQNITKMVQNSIYRRLIVGEQGFYNRATSLFGTNHHALSKELPALARAMGITFLPWWKTWVTIADLKPIAKAARRDKHWGGKRLFFYYLIQKV